MRLPAALARLGIVPELDLAAVLAELAGLPLAGKEDLQPDQDILARFNRRFLARNSALPLAVEEGRLRAALAAPHNHAAIEAMEFASSLPVNACVATLSDIEEALRDTTGIDGDLGGLANDFADGAAHDVERLLEGDSEAPVIRLVQQILTQAANRRASDVHIERATAFRGASQLTER